MPPKRKKTSKNGYWEFVLECRAKQPSTNQQDIEAYAGQKWANMSPVEREPYMRRAQIANHRFKAVKMTTDGIEIEAIERKEKETAARQLDMKADIAKNLKAASFANNLSEQVFLIVHINHLVYHPPQDKFYICEIAVAAVSLKNGIEDIFYRLVKPGKLPLGYYGGALAHSKETHQLIDLVQSEPFENSTFEVFRDLTDFMKSFANKYGPMVLFCDEKTTNLTTKVMNEFCHEFNYDEDIRVYSLEYLFYVLRNTVAGKTVWPTESFSYSQLEKDIYCFTNNISCDFHEVSDVPVYCSKSIVTRYAYTICDHCCQDLNIQLVPGFHVPAKSKVKDPRSRAASVMSNDGFKNMTSDQYFEAPSTSYEDSFPTLGRRSESSASSVVSFSSMKSNRGPVKAAARIEQSFKAMSFKEATRRNLDGMNFPELGSKRN